MATIAPRDLRAENAQGRLVVVWPDGETDFALVDLRGQCQCAHCVDEWTGERILDPTTIPDDIGIVGMELVGNYAVRIRWSDGHHAGLFTWDRLRALGS